MFVKYIIADVNLSDKVLGMSNQRKKTKYIIKNKVNYTVETTKVSSGIFIKKVVQLNY